MKKLDEVIIGLDLCNNYRFCSSLEYGDCPYLNNEDNSCEKDTLFKNDILYYLKKYQEDKKTWEKERESFHEVEQQYLKVIFPDNPSLVWNKLKKMEGEPIWIEEGNNSIGWCVIGYFYSDTLYTKEGKTFSKYTINNKWKAYKYKYIPLDKNVV